MWGVIHEAVARKIVEPGLQNTLDTDLRQENEAKSGGYHDYYIKPSYSTCASFLRSNRSTLHVIKICSIDWPPPCTSALLYCMGFNPWPSIGSWTDFTMSLLNFAITILWSSWLNVIVKKLLLLQLKQLYIVGFQLGPWNLCLWVSQSSNLQAFILQTD